MLILAGGSNGKPLDYGELEPWTRVGFERGTRSLREERCGRCVQVSSGSGE